MQIGCVVPVPPVELTNRTHWVLDSEGNKRTEEGTFPSVGYVIATADNRENEVGVEEVRGLFDRMV